MVERQPWGAEILRFTDGDRVGPLAGREKTALTIAGVGSDDVVLDLKVGQRGDRLTNTIAPATWSRQMPSTIVTRCPFTSMAMIPKLR